VAGARPIGYEERMKALTISLLFVLPAFPSCFLSRNTTNVPLQSKRLDVLQPGTSTAAEVAATLGAPNEVVQLGKRMAWRYDFTAAKRTGFTIIVLTLLNEDARSDRAWLFFDENSVLQYSSRTLDADGVQYAMPWQDLED
jgi:hypothetical protein